MEWILSFFLTGYGQRLFYACIHEGCSASLAISYKKQT